MHLIAFFLFGLLGSGVYLFTLLVKGDSSTVKNMCKLASAKVMVPLFIVIGGGVTVIYQLFVNEPFAIENAWEVFLVGFGWLGILASYTAGQKVAEASETDATARNMQKRLDILEQRLKEKG